MYGGTAVGDITFILCQQMITGPEKKSTQDLYSISVTNDHDFYADYFKINI